MERNYGFDNVKGILIFCAVLGHLLEYMVGDGDLRADMYSFGEQIYRASGCISFTASIRKTKRLNEMKKIVQS